MLILMQRFDETFTCEIPEGVELPFKPNTQSNILKPTTDKVEPPNQDTPEICVLESVEAVTKLLKCIFPELEGHHLEIVCDHEGGDGEEDEDDEDDPNPKDGLDIS